MHQSSSLRPWAERTVFFGDTLISLLHFTDMNGHQEGWQKSDLPPETWYILFIYFIFRLISTSFCTTSPHKRGKIILVHCDIEWEEAAQGNTVVQRDLLIATSTKAWMQALIEEMWCTSPSQQHSRIYKVLKNESKSKEPLIQRENTEIR